MSRFDPSNFQKSTQPDSGELLSELVSLFSISIMSVLFGIKTFNVQFKYLSYSRWLVLTLYILSWSFTMSAAIFASTNNGNYMSCFLSEMTCDIFYSGTKIVIYCWLIEKVWVVSASRESRWKTISYRFHIFLLTPYIAIFTLMIIFHIAELEETGMCIIGLQPIASIPLLIYDFVFNMYMTILFVRPLVHTGDGVRVNWKESRLHHVARRTLVASIVSLLVSLANIMALTILNGRERGVLCLSCCIIDVTINVITIHWVTNTGKISSKLSKNVNSNATYPNTHHLDNRDVKEENQLPMDRFSMDDAVPSYYDAIAIHHGYETRFNGYKNTIEEDCVSESRRSSIQESQSSRKSLTKR
ncbi:uncharacterized protein BX663DRAFT_497043 [Cokeromyces recurvatus]|uniref:uncharacterized protein n=1 Tax=Cokeromyces recurvatus TaxID=90255 RepID=UPI0022212A01|nr:uncharacterized protein BX663DRAFT_497043 [Cokeromyces recurvatus]KAI7906600.1 hypothetical protein BX663DRAFT_497043 [Cokeromyces recurvatus]